MPPGVRAFESRARCAYAGQGLAATKHQHVQAVFNLLADDLGSKMIFNVRNVGVLEEA